MATTPTNLPVPSESPIDLKFNAGKIDEFVTSMGWTYTDRFGQKHYTIEGINYLAQQAMAAFGYVILTGKTSTTGATINNPNEVLLNTADGEYYKWTGSFASGPKEVPANSTPSSTGGVGPGAWLGVGDSSLRAALASVNGADLIGYKNPQSQISETLNVALDKINVRLIYASDFGVKTDSSDNADALWNLGQFISNATEPLYVIFPHGTSLVGSQEFAGATGKGYSYRPSYFSRPWGDPSDRGWFSVHRTDNDITLDMTGWTLKMNDGMKHGSFDPVTGAVAADQISETPNVDYLASHGYMIKLYKCHNVILKKGKTVGNIAGSIWGGKYGNTGYQVPSYNAWINQSSGVTIDGHEFSDSPVDLLYQGETTSFTADLLNTIPKTKVINCLFHDAGRNLYSLVGGANILIEDCLGYNSGNLATNIGTRFSGPECGVDIEAEGGSIYGVTLNRCKFINTGKASLMTVSTPGIVSTIKAYSCVFSSFSSEGAIINYGSTRTVSFNKCSIVGSIKSIGMGLDAYSFEKCTFQNRYGSDYVPSYLLDFSVYSFSDNSITFAIPPDKNVSSATFNISDQAGIAFGQGQSRCQNNRIIVYGDATKITFVNGLGGFNNFKGLEIFTQADGITSGTTKLIVNTSSQGAGGLSTNSASFNYGTTMIKEEGKNIWFSSTPTRTPGVLNPAANSAQDLGNVGARWRTGYLDLGMITSSPNGTKYRLRIGDDGVPYTTIDNG